MKNQIIFSLTVVLKKVLFPKLNSLYYNYPSNTLDCIHGNSSECKSFVLFSFIPLAPDISSDAKPFF